MRAERVPAMLLLAPHRGMFAAGAIQALLAMAWWLTDLAGRHGGVPWRLTFAPPLPPSWLHACWLIYGVFAFFIFGFILTAGPRWLQQPDTPPSVFRPALLLLAGGWLLADVGLVVPMLMPFGLAVALAGWIVAAAFLWRLFRAASPGNRMHVGLMATAQTAGAAGLSGFVVLAAGGPFQFGPPSIALGLWGFLLPVFLIVIHRMLPFFSQGIIPSFRPQRPVWALWLMVAGSWGHGLLGLSGLPGLAFLADLPAAAAAFYLTAVWRLRASFAATILAVLHVAFAWVGIGFALLAADSLLLALGASGLGLAPLHALTVGFMSSALVGMASRVTLGHSGRPIVGDRVMWGCFWTMQTAAAVRVGGEFVPVVQSLAAAFWLLAFALWAGRYAPAWWRPREDGKPG